MAPRVTAWVSSNSDAHSLLRSTRFGERQVMPFLPTINHRACRPVGDRTLGRPDDQLDWK